MKLTTNFKTDKIWFNKIIFRFLFSSNINIDLLDNFDDIS